jgi:hypothetical protein
MVKREKEEGGIDMPTDEEALDWAERQASKKCLRCGKTDQELLTNGYCRRCDDVLYGYKPKDWLPPYKPNIWYDDSTGGNPAKRAPPQRTVMPYRACPRCNGYHGEVGASPTSTAKALEAPCNHPDVSCPKYRFRC